MGLGHSSLLILEVLFQPVADKDGPSRLVRVGAGPGVGRALLGWWLILQGGSVTAKKHANKVMALVTGLV